MRDPAEGMDDEVTIAERRTGHQRREAFRVRMNMPVHVDSPMKLYCEVVDISVLGVRFDRDLPCTPGVNITFRIVIPSYGATLDLVEFELGAEVVRVGDHSTGVRFVEMTPGEARAIRELVHAHQRAQLLAARRAVLDRRVSGPHR
jgi:c-di-GMP-binding flagellar brake protein YcgR